MFFIVRSINSLSAENECSASERQQCDSGNSRSECARDSGGSLICVCPNGYTLDANMDCQGIVNI